MVFPPYIPPEAGCPSVHGCSAFWQASTVNQQMVELGTCCTRRGTMPTNRADGPRCWTRDLPAWQAGYEGVG